MALQSYISARGAEELEAIRVGFEAKATGTKPLIELLARVPSDECGCPEELWLVDGAIYLIHIEPDGSGEIFAFFGETETDTIVKVQTLDQLRAEMFELHAGLAED